MADHHLCSPAFCSALLDVIRHIRLRQQTGMFKLLLFPMAFLVLVSFSSGEAKSFHIDGGATRTVPYLDENFVLNCHYLSSVYYLGSRLRWKKHRLVPPCVPPNQTLDSGAVCMNSNHNETHSFALLRFGKISSESSGTYKCRRIVEGQREIQQVNVKVVRKDSAPPVVIHFVKNVSDLHQNRTIYIGVLCVFQSLTDGESDMKLSVIWKDEGGVPISEQVKSEMAFQKKSVLYYPANSEDIATNFCELSSPYYNKSITRKLNWSIKTTRTEATMAPHFASSSVKQPTATFSLIPTFSKIQNTSEPAVTKMRAYSSEGISTPGASNKQTANDNSIVIASLSLAGCLLLALVVVIVCYCKRRSSAVVWREPKLRLSIRQRQAEKKLLWLQENAADLSMDRIHLVKVVGNGFFGVVCEALVKDLIAEEDQTRVAVKLINDDTNVEAYPYDCLIEEAVIMKKFGGHEHVVTLLGICREQNQLWLLMEYAEHGNLRAYLRQKRCSSNPLDGERSSTDLCLNTETTLHFALQVAKGMAHLALQKCIHRDLAARNVLVFTGEKLKISDFGLAKDIHYQEYYRKASSGVVPVKWTAPEAMIHKIYSEASDVWSFGVVLWEIVTKGGTPYPGIDAAALYHLLVATPPYRMTRPPGCSRTVYNLMASCWKSQPLDRPKFSTLVTTISRLVSEMKDLIPTS